MLPGHAENRSPGGPDLIGAVLLALGGWWGVAAPPAPQARVHIGVREDDRPFSEPGFRTVVEGYFVGSGLTPVVDVLPPSSGLMDHVAWASGLAASGDVHVVFWFEPMEQGRHLLYLLQPGSEQTWVREVPRSTDDDLVIESAGIMLSTLATGSGPGDPMGMKLLEDGTPPPEPEPTTPAPVEVPTPPPPPPRPEFSFGVEYIGGNLEEHAVWQSGVGGHVDVVFPSSAFIRVSSGYIQPAEIEGTAPLKLWRVPVVGRVGYRFRAGHAFRPELYAAVAVEAFWWESDDADGVRGRAGTTGRLALGPGAGFRWRVARGFGLQLNARMDIWLVNVDLVYEGASDRQSRFRPHAVAGVIQAGFHYAL